MNVNPLHDDIHNHIRRELDEPLEEVLDEELWVSMNTREIASPKQGDTYLGTRHLHEIFITEIRTI